MNLITHQTGPEGKKVEKELVGSDSSDERVQTLLKENNALHLKMKELDAVRKDLAGKKAEVDSLNVQKISKEELNQKYQAKLKKSEKDLSELQAETEKRVQALLNENKILQAKAKGAESLKEDLVQTKTQLDHLRRTKDFGGEETRRLRARVQKSEQELIVILSSIDNRVQGLMGENRALQEKVDETEVLHAGLVRMRQQEDVLKLEKVETQEGIQRLRFRLAQSENELQQILTAVDERFQTLIGAGGGVPTVSNSDEVQALKESLARTKTQYEALNRERVEREKVGRKLEKRLREAEQEVEAMYGIHEERSDASRREKRVLEERLSEVQVQKKNFAKARAMVEALGRQGKNDKEAAETLTANLKKTEDELTTLRATSEELGSQQATLKERLGQVENENKTLATRSEKLDSTIADLEKAQGLLAQLEKEKKSKTEENVELAVRLKKVEDDRQAKETQVSELVEKNKVLKDSLSATQEEKKNLAYVVEDMEVYKLELAKTRALLEAVEEEKRVRAMTQEDLRRRLERAEVELRLAKTIRDDELSRQVHANEFPKGKPATSDSKLVGVLKFGEPLSLPRDEISPGVAAVFAGKVSYLNRNGKFVILNFPQGALPPVRSKLDVYREGTPVGSLLVTDPVVPPYVSANIVNGSVQQGDEVR
jgi:chromosome segregation ATPase